ncbi:MAG: DNA-processing protein DprA [Bacteroidetes bacterium]|nr:DNA-processing protein DprA [Bacteroidota bacterium]
MTLQDKHYLLALQLVPGVGPVIAKNLVAYAGNPRAVFEKPRGQLLRIPDVGPRLAEALRADLTPYLKRAEENIAFSEKYGIRLLDYSEQAYPEALKAIYNAPLVLFVKGPLALNEVPAVAIVGTRNVTDYGRTQAARFAAHFAACGLNVVSGLAYGVDIAAHKAVTEAGGITTGVLAHGLDRIYPAAHRSAAERMLARGALVTEYLTGTQPDASHFPARNRILSGLCQGVVVIEAAEKGGALITARTGFEQNRSIYALPGRVGDLYSAGCNRLVSENIARLVTSPEEVLADLGLGDLPAQAKTKGPATRFKPVAEHLSAEEQQVLNLLETGDMALESLVLKTRIPAHKLVTLLLTLEFRGYVAQKPGQVFKRL